jgi:hypothetical protein
MEGVTDFCSWQCNNTGKKMLTQQTLPYLREAPPPPPTPPPQKKEIEKISKYTDKNNELHD